MSKIDIDPVGRFATALKSAIEEADLSLTEVAEKADSSYEHIRKLIAGKALPSMYLLRILASVLKGDKEKWAELCEADRFFKNNKRFAKTMHQSPELEILEPLFPHLTKGNQEAVVSMVRTLLKQQRQQHATR